MEFVSLEELALLEPPRKPAPVRPSQQELQPPPLKNMPVKGHLGRRKQIGRLVPKCVHGSVGESYSVGGLDK